MAWEPLVGGVGVVASAMSATQETRFDGPGWTIVATGTDGGIWFRHQPRVGPLSEWRRVDRDGISAGNPALVDHQDGSAEIFVVGADHRIWSLSGDPSAGFAGGEWSQVQAAGRPLFVSFSPAALRLDDGTVWLSARTFDSQIIVSRRGPGAAFTEPVGLPASPSGQTWLLEPGMAAVASQAFLFAVDYEHAGWVSQLQGAGGPWGPWQSLGGRSISGVTGGLDGPNWHAYALGTDSQVYFVTKPAQGTWTTHWERLDTDLMSTAPAATYHAQEDLVGFGTLYATNMNSEPATHGARP